MKKQTVPIGTALFQETRTVPIGTDLLRKKQTVPIGTDFTARNEKTFKQSENRENIRAQREMSKDSSTKGGRSGILQHEIGVGR